MRTYSLRSELLIAAPIDQVFDFFSKAENLEKLTPSSLRFEILTPLPIQMMAGALIEYRLSLLGVPFKWLTEITAWEPGRRFVDVQRKGPYAKWEHEHTFEPRGDSTLMRDSLVYAVPGFFLAPLVQSLFVGRQVEKIFEYRSKAIAELFARPRTQVSPL